MLGTAWVNQETLSFLSQEKCILVLIDHVTLLFVAQVLSCHQKSIHISRIHGSRPIVVKMPDTALICIKTTLQAWLVLASWTPRTVHLHWWLWWHWSAQKKSIISDLKEKQFHWWLRRHRTALTERFVWTSTSYPCCICMLASFESNDGRIRSSGSRVWDAAFDGVNIY